MTLDLYAFQMLDGRRLTPLPVSKAGWSLVTNADESITCSIPARDPKVRKLGIWATTYLARNGLLATVDNTPIAAGPIWKREYDADKGTIELTAGGLRSYWNRRVLLPLAARDASLVDANGDPVEAFDTDITGSSYGTIAKKWIQLARLWPGGSIPMQFPADEPGDREKPVAAIDLKMVGKLIDDLSNLESGPDFAFVPRWSSDGLGIYWEMQHGTTSVPRLGATDAAARRWTIGAPRSGAFGRKISEDGTNLASQSWFSGGGSSDRVITARGYNPTLVDGEYPLLDMVNKGHNDVKVQATAQSYADQDVALNQFASSFWSMNVRAREKGSPMLGVDYWLGDMATVSIDPSEPVLGQDASYDVVRRIASISGDEKDDFYPVDFAEAVA